MAGKMSNLAADMGHPDENLLAAFVERSLAAHDRERVLRHLSVCSRCREVVFLAQQAEPGSFSAQPGSASDREKPEHEAGWRIAWIAIPAMAAILLAVVSVRWYAGSHLPKNTAPAAAPAQTMAMNQPAPLPAAAQSANVAADNLQSKTEARAARRERPPQEKRSDRMESNTAVIAGTVEQPPHIAASQPLPQTSRTVTVAAAPLQTETQAQSLPEGIPQEAPHPVPMAVHPMTVNGGVTDAPVFSANTVAHGSASAGFVTAAPVLLPSGLRAVNLVRVTGRHVALDQDGNLFLRANTNSAWTPIAKQWTGKAASLRADPSMQSTGRFSMMMKKAPDDSGQETAPLPPTLRLTNDTGQVWTSVDSGETWHPLPLQPPQQK
jgi:hypothetical protein